MQCSKLKIYLFSNTYNSQLAKKEIRHHLVLPIYTTTVNRYEYCYKIKKKMKWHWTKGI